jgi:hypothetical protein
MRAWECHRPPVPRCGRGRRGRAWQSLGSQGSNAGQLFLSRIKGPAVRRRARVSKSERSPPLQCPNSSQYESDVEIVDKAYPHGRPVQRRAAGPSPSAAKWMHYTVHVWDGTLYCMLPCCKSRPGRQPATHSLSLDSVPQRPHWRKSAVPYSSTPRWKRRYVRRVVSARSCACFYGCLIMNDEINRKFPRRVCLRTV